MSMGFENLKNLAPCVALCVYLLALSIQRLIVDLLLGPMLRNQVWIGLGGGLCGLGN